MGRGWIKGAVGCPTPPYSDLNVFHFVFCMLLIDNFPVTFEGRRSTKRRLEREDCEDSPRKKDPLAKTAAEEILVSSEEEDGEKHPFISSAMAASQWCSAKKMGDKVILPQILSMAPLDREAALHDLERG
ncbi:NADH-quinone oxidoreductase subunit C/D [Dissostichus eleginoides]|uniref:NADH-quinone oxidoreductase subunit C/D n=1 Tax=Dissostichus eleginoides TaxID=100907 RepID=A0AAD9BS47_DISEL|nr:NADH-quinone oxidoreductase subunit C/D [Dissostichus eleginoides]